jgi:GNAT superfamily N-acetyltransferase
MSLQENQMDATQVEVRREDIDSRTALSRIGALNEELSTQYPEPGATHFRLDAGEVAEGRGTFVIAYAGTTPVGCGAIRRLDLETAEIKRMYVAPIARGRGVGRMVLTKLEDEARRLGVNRIVLETGVRQVEAIALYTRAGFSPIPAFGEYVSSALSVCMGKKVYG